MDPPITVLIYVDTTRQVGDPDHLKVFANADAAEAWFAENDPEGVAFEYEVMAKPYDRYASRAWATKMPALRTKRIAATTSKNMGQPWRYK
jgi:hypothetical protein